MSKATNRVLNDSTWEWFQFPHPPSLPAIVAFANDRPLDGQWQASEVERWCSSINSNRIPMTDRPLWWLHKYLMRTTGVIHSQKRSDFIYPKIDKDHDVIIEHVEAEIKYKLSNTEKCRVWKLLHLLWILRSR